MPPIIVQTIEIPFGKLFANVLAGGRSLCWLCLPVLLLLGCAEEPVSWKNRRQSGYQRPEIQVPESRLNLPIRLPMEQLQEALNKKLPVRLMTKKSITGGLTVTMQRSGAIELSGTGKNLVWSVPVKVLIGHPIMKAAISSFDVKPEFSSKLELRENYHLKGLTTLKKITWISPATLRLLGADIDLTESVDELIREQQALITAGIDDELARVNIQNVLAKTWRKLNNPIRVNRQVQPVYLLVAPSKLQLRDLVFHQNVLALDLGVYGSLETVYDSASNVRSDAPYPPFTIGDDQALVNELYLPLVISFERINSILRERLFGLHFEVEGQKLVLDSVEISSVDSLMLITTSLSGDVELKIEMLGRPIYVEDSSTLTVQGFDYQVLKSNTSLLSFGDYFFHDEVVAELMTKLNLPLGSYIDTIPSLIYRGVERGRSGDKINLNTSLERIALDQFYIGYDDIALVIFAKGKLELEVEQIGKKDQKP